MNRLAKGVLIASAAAGLFLSGAVAAQAADDKAGGDKVKCLGANACKGQGTCASAHNECKGQNACKGKGMNEMSAADCKAKGGTVESDKKM